MPDILETLSSTEPSKETNEEVKTEGGDQQASTEASQEDLDWREKISDANTKTAVMKFKTVEDLAQGYKNLESMMGNKVDPFDSKWSASEQANWLKKVANLTDESYKDLKLDEDVAKPFKDFGVHPEITKEIHQSLKEVMSVKRDEEVKLQIEKNIEKLKSSYDEEKLSRNVAVALESLGLSNEEFKSVFKENASDPVLIKKLYELGEKTVKSDPIVAVKEGESTGGLTSNFNELSEMEHNLIREKTSQGVSEARIYQINNDLKKIAAKKSGILKKPHNSLF